MEQYSQYIGIPYIPWRTSLRVLGEIVWREKNPFSCVAREGWGRSATITLPARYNTSSGAVSAGVYSRGNNIPPQAKATIVCSGRAYLCCEQGARAKVI